MKKASIGIYELIGWIIAIAILAFLLWFAMKGAGVQNGYIDKITEFG